MSVRTAFDQWAQLWTGLSRWQQVSVVAGVLLTVGAVIGFSHWQSETDYKPLFTGMSAEDAGAVVQKLKETGVEHRVGGDGSTVLVRSAAVAETRLTMAAQGLPKTGRIGFELFDRTNLGSTDFAEHVNYRRALEGELERSIRSIAAVESARVHLTFPKDSVFLEARAPAKASVMLSLRSGSELTAANVAAVANLVAGAVEGLAASAVSIMDVRGNLLNRPKKTQEAGDGADEQLEYRQRIEKDLLAKIDSTLEPLLGVGKYRASVSADTDMTSGEQSEEKFDPDNSVMVTSTKTEETNAGAASGGVPGTASNLPRSAARSAGGGISVSRKSETIAYQTSKTVRRTQIPHGSLKRLSVGLLLDHTVRWEQRNGKPYRILTPLGPENIRAIREIVTAAAGLVASRGDQLVIESLPFDSTLQEPTPPGSDKPEAQPATQIDPWKLLQERRLEALGILAVVALGIWAAVKKGKKRPKVRATMQPALPEGTTAAVGGAAPAPELSADATRLLATAKDSLRQEQTKKIEVLVESLRKDVDQDAYLAAGVLRGWLEDQQT